MSESFEAVIGLEVHCQLLTESKAFSPDSAAFGAEPNHHVDPVSLGHPGTLPVLNEQVVAHTIRMGLATNCQIAPRSVLARKHYFYPDLPKGYQISQFETPICADGHLTVVMDQGDSKGDERTFGITRIHIEEDAGKSVHDVDPLATLLDYNRCGVPLIEIVSEPDLRSPREAYLYLRKIRQLVRYLGICDGNMEEGSLRCDANISVRPQGQTELGTKTEIKNLNSFRNVERALEHEIARQISLVRAGEEIVQETLLWDADAGRTRSMRSKEEAHDYRYFPDPDLCPIVVTDAMLEEARRSLPTLPDARMERYIASWGVPAYNAAVLTEERAVSDYFEAVVGALNGDPADGAQAASNVIMTDGLRLQAEHHLDFASFPVEPKRMAALVALRLEDRISSTAQVELLEHMLNDGRDPEAIAAERNLVQESDAGALEPYVDEVLAAHPDNVRMYLSGKAGLIGFFIGQVMRSYPGSPDPKLVRELFVARLASMDNESTE
ncbi:MAG: Asp-tRNA(Asn)/Glu-tRNA(Gln) amidotransferase subunit GatB [Rhodothermales bacterium]|nr:Asp-tRNA(Asn)/Glu-tRNA(Gln) amidotransferase subunit GatB [Rhodothermales bacterium]MBO6781296.1 Asp-tRNA(Asn)/Glu-tRNA(Gln) amidotransferase subunit GatB [Rhodothermales bacterium]